MKTLGDRLRHLRNEKSVTQEEMGKELNIAKSTVSQYENNVNIPDAEMLKKLADYYHTSVDYLLGRPSPNMKYLPILGTIRAGLPLLAEENWDGRVEVPVDLKADFALRVIGDSMSWVGIYEGDLAILRKTDVAQHGMIVAAGVEDTEWSATLKFFVKENGAPVLQAANPNYADIPMNGHHRIIGQVISIQKNPPSLFTYRHFLNTKDSFDQNWNDTIEMATKLGLDAKQIQNYLDMLSSMIRQTQDRYSTKKG